MAFRYNWDEYKDKPLSEMPFELRMSVIGKRYAEAEGPMADVESVDFVTEEEREKGETTESMWRYRAAILITAIKRDDKAVQDRLLEQEAASGKGTCTGYGIEAPQYDEMEYGESPLIVAIQKGDEALALSFIKLDAAVDNRNSNFSEGAAGETPLLYAAESGNSTIFDAVLGALVAQNNKAVVGYPSMLRSGHSKCQLVKES